MSGVEILGAVASSIAIVAAVGKLGKQAIALKRLCDEVEDNPQTLQDHVDHLERLVPILDRMENEFAKAPSLLKEGSFAQQSFTCCRLAATNLEDLVKGFQIQVDAVKKKNMKQRIVKFKVRLKKNLVDDLERKLEKNLELLKLAQSTYQTALTTKVLELVIVNHQMIRLEDNSIKPSDPASTTQGSITASSIPQKAATRPPRKSNRSSFKYQRLPWSNPGYLPRLYYAAIDGSVTIDDDSPPTGEKDQDKAYQVRFQLPFWIAQKVWDFQASRSYGQWTGSLRTWNVRPYDSEIFRLVREGTTDEILKAFAMGSASVYDCSEDGWSLLDLAFTSRHINLEVITLLTDMHVSLKNFETTLWGATWSMVVCEEAGSGRRGVRKLIEHCTFADERDLGYSMTELKEAAYQVVMTMIWGDLGDSEFPLKELGAEFDVNTRQPDITEIIWEHRRLCPTRVLLYLKQEGVLPSTFRESMEKGRHSSLVDFALRYFDDCDGGEGTTESWRELARWIFRGAQPIELTAPKEIWTPLTASLIHASAFESTPMILFSTSQEPKPIHKVELEHRLEQWLEDLDTAGVDLMEYGKLESAQLTQAHIRPLQMLLDNWEHGFPVRSLKWEYIPYHLRYGPSPKDWHVQFMVDVFPAYEVEGYLVDFWRLVEPFEMSMPGGWVDEDE